MHSYSFAWFLVDVRSVLKIIKDQIQTLSISLNVFIVQLNPLSNPFSEFIRSSFSMAQIVSWPSFLFLFTS
jgi:hypothetical protein